MTTTRRGFLQGSAAAAVALATNLRLGGRARAAEDDPIRERIIYLVRNDGVLLMYVDGSTDSASNWLSTGIPAPPINGVTVNWANYLYVFSGRDGIIYAIDPNHQLVYFRLIDPARNGGSWAGTWRWSADSGTVIGYSWPAPGEPGGPKHVWGAGNGLIYVIDGSGNLRTYRHDFLDGGAVGTTWNNGTGVVSGAWGGTFSSVFSSSYSNIYAIDASGNLLWFDDHDQVGVIPWPDKFQNMFVPPTGTYVRGTADDGGWVIGTGWQGFSRVFSGGDGIIYAITSTGDLFRYRDRSQIGAQDWANGGSPVAIGSGWNIPSDYKFVFAEPGTYPNFFWSDARL